MGKPDSKLVSRISDKLLKDKQGNWAVFQKPNLPLYIWIAATVLSRIIKNGTLHNLLSWLAFVAIFIWALLEIFTGHSPIRRALGTAVLSLTIYSRLN